MTSQHPAVIFQNLKPEPPETTPETRFATIERLGRELADARAELARIQEAKGDVPRLERDLEAAVTERARLDGEARAARTNATATAARFADAIGTESECERETEAIVADAQRAAAEHAVGSATNHVAALERRLEAARTAATRRS